MDETMNGPAAASGRQAAHASGTEPGEHAPIELPGLPEAPVCGTARHWVEVHAQQQERSQTAPAPAASAAAVASQPAAPGPASQDARGRGDTRARIQQVAVALFAEQGYDKTSLREIAERLDVTKAALYYHFKSKEDIVRSLVEDYYGQIDALIAWGKAQPASPAARREILSRYVTIVVEGDEVFRMLYQNQAAVNSLASAKKRGELFRERMSALIELFTEPGASLNERLRAAMALGGVSVGWMSFADQVPDRAELRAAVLAIARDIAEGG
jgi:AcrR family transcriptional regulator